MALCHLNQLPCTVDKGTESCQLLIQTVLSPDGNIEISLLYPSTSNDGYIGNLPSSSLKSTAACLEIPFDRIYSETTKALTTNGGIENFLYDLNTESCEFVLRKKTGSLNVICARVPLNSEPLLKDALLQRAIDQNISNSNRFADLSLQFANLKREHADLTDAYEDCVAHKISMETELLSKFIVLLNSKKDKIAELQKELKHLGERLLQVEGTTDKRSRKQRIFDSEVITTDEELASSQERDDDVIRAKEPQPLAAVRMLNDSSQELSPAIVLPRRTKTAITDSPVKKNEFENSAQADDYAMNHLPGSSKDVPASSCSLSKVTDSPSVFDRDTEELISDM